MLHGCYLSNIVIMRAWATLLNQQLTILFIFVSRIFSSAMIMHEWWRNEVVLEKWYWKWSGEIVLKRTTMFAILFTWLFQLVNRFQHDVMFYFNYFMLEHRTWMSRLNNVSGVIKQIKQLLCRLIITYLRTL